MDKDHENHEAAQARPRVVKKLPKKHNRAVIFKAVEIAYLHYDSSGFGWGAVLNDCIEARGFWSGEDKGRHITFEELKAVRSRSFSQG